MKAIGFILVTVGFVVAALATVLDQGTIRRAESAAAQDPNAIGDPNVASDLNVIQSAVDDPNAVTGAGSETVADKGYVKWLWYIPALALGFAGVVLIRTSEAKESQTEHHVAANIETIETSLGRIVTNITQLDGDKDNINTYDVRHRIDELFVDDLETFVEARESIVHRYGLAAYGEVMTRFASAERYLNRVWSASADGYIDEVNEYLTRAKDQFAESLLLLKDLKATTPPA